MQMGFFEWLVYKRLKDKIDLVGSVNPCTRRRFLGGFWSQPEPAWALLKRGAPRTAGLQPGVTSLQPWKEIQAEERVVCQHTGAMSEGMSCSEGNPEPSLITKGPALTCLQISCDIFHASQLPRSTFLSFFKKADTLLQE